MSKKVVYFAPQQQGLRVNGVTDGAFAMTLEGKPPWSCSPEQWSLLQRAAPGLFVQTTRAGKPKEV